MTKSLMEMFDLVKALLMFIGITGSCVQKHMDT